MQTIHDFLVHYRRQRDWTRKLIGGVPEQHFGWAPDGTSFSCGELVRHLIQSEIFWTRLLMKAAAGESFDPFQIPGGAKQRLEAFRTPNLEASRNTKYGSSFAQCLAKWREVQDRTEQEFSKLDDGMLQLTGRHPLTGIEAPLWELLLIMLEHEGHHRGQLSAYLKVIGIEQTPDLWG